MSRCGMLCCSRCPRSVRILLLTLTVLWAGPAHAMPALFDFGDGPVQTGWAGVDPVSPTAISQGIQLVLSATAAAGFDDRDRGPGGNGGGTESDMWRDFIFAVPDPGETVGLLIELSGLTPGASYDVTIWSYDSFGGGANLRSSTWNGEPYSFNPVQSPDPETLDDLNIVVQVQADAAGTAQVLGNSLETTDPGVFINGMRVQVPEPVPALLLGLALLGLAAHRRAASP